MKVVLDSFAWVEKGALKPETLANLRERLTVLCTGFGKDLKPIRLFVETDELIGLPRAYYLRKHKAHHEVTDHTLFAEEHWPGDLSFRGALRAEQQRALAAVEGHLRGEQGLGGLLQAPPGWGKTVWACALIARLRVPTLVLVHKEFLLDQWCERLRSFLPGVVVGRVQGDECSVAGAHVVLGMMQSLSQREYPGLAGRFGLLMLDEAHHVSAESWAPIPGMFPARWRVGITATPRRKDGAENVFLDHIGDILFAAEEQRLKLAVRYVFTEFRLSQYDRMNTNLTSRGVVLNLMAANPERNRSILDQLVLAVRAGRKILLVSERIEHLERIDMLVREEWPPGEPMPTVSFYIGGLTRQQQREAEKAQVILATSQLVTEGLDIPALDTLFLAMPLSDVEQACGRILRPHPGKKPPVVVDFRDDRVGLFKGQAGSRQEVYRKLT